MGIDFDKGEVAKLSIERFVELHLPFKSIKEMGLKDGEKWLKKKYNELTREARAIQENRPKKSIRSIRKR